MKKIVLLLFAVAAGFLTVNAQDHSRLVISAGQLKKITLGEDMKVVLVSAESFASEIKGGMNVFEKLNISVVDGAMRINAGQKLLKNETVFVVVNELQSLTVGEHTKVTTEGILRGPSIKVYVQEGSVARLKTTAKVKAYSPGNEIVSIETTPIQLRATAGAFDIDFYFEK